VIHVAAKLAPGKRAHVTRVARIAKVVTSLRAQ
jgi:hypothetical protein